MYFHAVETTFTTEIHCLSETFYNAMNFIFCNATINCRRVKIKTTGRSVRCAFTNGFVCHIAAMSKLYTGFGTFCMNGIGEFFQTGLYLIVDIELSVKTGTGTFHRTIGNRCHAYTSSCNCNMIVFQLLRRLIINTHIFKSR